MNMNFKKIIGAAIIVAIGLYQAIYEPQSQNNTSITPPASSSTPAFDHSSPADNYSKDSKPIIAAIEAKQGDTQVYGKGLVVAVLADDTKGSQHQKFILKLSSGDTILVAHNIDLAPRLNNLKKGDVVEFYGEYEWNDKGGVVHWTHKDPGKRHIDGWLKANGQFVE